MIDGMKILGVIPARGGSKGVAKKNMAFVQGRPLLSWTLHAAKASMYLDEFIVSSDDLGIIDFAKSQGCRVPFVRPNELALDETSSVDVVLHAVSELPGYDVVVLLQPTSPLRSTRDIDACIELCREFEYRSVVSVTSVKEPPEWMFHIDGQKMNPVIASAEGKLPRRQDCRPTFRLNGAVYVAQVSALMHSKAFVDFDTIPYVMPAERSLDIDEPEDLTRLEFYLNSQNGVG